MEEARGGKGRLARLYGVLGIPAAEVLNVYLVGSRLFGVNKPGADYDLKVVIADDSSYAGPADVQRGDGHGFEVDAHVYPLRTFLDRVEEQDPQVLTCLFLPRTSKPATLLDGDDGDDRDGHSSEHGAEEEEEEDWVWKESVPIEYFPRLIKLYRSVYHEADTNWSKAFRLWRRRDRIVAAMQGQHHESLSKMLTGRVDDDDPVLLHYRAKKCIVHAIRFAHFGLQLAKHGAITDYKVANDLFYEILPEAKQRDEDQRSSSEEERSDDAVSLQAPAYYEAKYEPMMRSLIKQLKSYTESEAKKAEAAAGEDPLPASLHQNIPSRRKGRAKPTGEQSEHVNEVRQLLEFLNQREDGIRELSRNFGIKVKKSLTHSGIYHLSYSDSSSPMGCPLVRACRAIVLARENDQWRVVCYAFPKFYYYTPQQIFERGNRDPSRLLQLPADVESGPVEATSQMKGVMVTLYWYRGAWILNTLASPDGSHIFSVRRGSPIAEQKKFTLNPVSSLPLADYFWSVWRRKYEQSEGQAYRLPVLPENIDKRIAGIRGGAGDGEQESALTKCYIFEFTSPHLQVISVTRPQQSRSLTNEEELAEEEKITLLDIRDLRTLNLLPRSEVEANAAAYGWDCVACHHFSSFAQSVNEANALPFYGNSKGLILQAKMPGPQGGREVMTRLPSPSFIAYVNLKERPSEEEKGLDPDSWEWHKEDYDFDSMNRLCMLEIVRWQYCSGPDDETREDPVYLQYWSSEHQALYGHVRRTFLDYAQQLQTEFDQVIDEMLQLEQAENAERDQAEGREGSDTSTKHDQSDKRDRREELVRTSLRIMNNNDKRWFAQVVTRREQHRLSEAKRPREDEEGEAHDPYRALLFEMKKEGFGTVRELMARVHIKYLEELLFACRNNKLILV